MEHAITCEEAPGEPSAVWRSPIFFLGHWEPVCRHRRRHDYSCNWILNGSDILAGEYRINMTKDFSESPLGRATSSNIFYLLRSYSQAYSRLNSLPPSPNRALWNVTPISQAIFTCIGTKRSVYIRKEFNSHRIGLVHQHHGRRFFVLKH